MPEELVKATNSCWNNDPEKRMSISQLLKVCKKLSKRKESKKILKNLIDESSNKVDLLFKPEKLKTYFDGDNFYLFLFEKAIKKEKIQFLNLTGRNWLKEESSENNTENHFSLPYSYDLVEVVNNKLWTFHLPEYHFRVWNFKFPHFKLEKQFKAFPSSYSFYSSSSIPSNSEYSPFKMIFKIYEQTDKKYLGSMKLISRLVAIDTNNSLFLYRPYSFISKPLSFPPNLGDVSLYHVCQPDLINKSVRFILVTNKFFVVFVQWQKKKDELEILRSSSFGAFSSSLHPPLSFNHNFISSLSFSDDFIFGYSCNSIFRWNILEEEQNNSLSLSFTFTLNQVEQICYLRSLHINQKSYLFVSDNNSKLFVFKLKDQNQLKLICSFQLDCKILDLVCLNHQIVVLDEQKMYFISFFSKKYKKKKKLK